MCHTLVMKPCVRAFLQPPPAFLGQIESDAQRPSIGGSDRLASLSLPPSLLLKEKPQTAAAACRSVVGSDLDFALLYARSWTRRNWGADDGAIIIIAIIFSIFNTDSATLYFPLRGAGSRRERAKIKPGLCRRFPSRETFLYFYFLLFITQLVKDGDANFPAVESRSAVCRRGHIHQVSRALLFVYAFHSKSL